MFLPRKISVLVLCAGVVCATGFISISESTITAQMSAQQKWSPRRVPSGTQFIGDKACGNCHKRAFAPYSQTGMALAMEPITESKVLTENPKLTLQLGPYTYEIKRDGKQSFYSVTDGKNTISVPIQYAVGQGRMGQTYVLQRDGKF
jgi:hypothetical protein